jgi:hypothetical protein
MDEPEGASVGSQCRFGLGRQEEKRAEKATTRFEDTGDLRNVVPALVGQQMCKERCSQGNIEVTLRIRESVPFRP